MNWNESAKILIDLEASRMAEEDPALYYWFNENDPQAADCTCDYCRKTARYGRARLAHNPDASRCYCDRCEAVGWRYARAEYRALTQKRLTVTDTGRTKRFTDGETSATFTREPDGAMRLRSIERELEALDKPKPWHPQPTATYRRRPPGGRRHVPVTSLRPGHVFEWMDGTPVVVKAQPYPRTSAWDEVTDTSLIVPTTEYGDLTVEEPTVRLVAVTTPRKPLRERTISEIARQQCTFSNALLTGLSTPLAWALWQWVTR